MMGFLCGNQRGSILIPVLLAGVTISLGFTVMIYRLVTQVESHMTIRDRLTLSSIQTQLQMVLSLPSACKANLKSGRFGTTLSELQQRATSGQMAITLPGAVSDRTATIAPGAAFQRLTVTSVTMKPPVQLVPGDSAYLTELSVTLTAAKSSSKAHKVSFPIYLETDAGGTLLNCFSTSKIAQSDGTVYTLEDHMCAQMNDGNMNFIYRYKEHFCFNKGDSSSTLAKLGMTP